MADDQAHRASYVHDRRDIAVGLIGRVRADPYGQPIDWAVAAFFRESWRGGAPCAHMIPSIVQHIGDVSTLDVCMACDTVWACS